MSFFELALRVREHERDGFANRVSGIGEARLQRSGYANSGHRGLDLGVCALNLSIGSHALLTLSEGLKRRLERCYILLKQECMLGEVLRTANDGLGALEAVASHAWLEQKGLQR